MTVELPVVNEKVNRLRNDFDCHVKTDGETHGEIFNKLDSIVKDYANRLPVWGSLLLAALFGLLGALLTALFLRG